MRRLPAAWVFVLFLSLPASAQPVLLKISHHYFRSDPYLTSYSSFLQHLFNDPTLSERTMFKKTDTTLFFFKGKYEKHNPFSFTPSRVEVILRESPVDLDSLHSDTIYTYQLFAWLPDSAANKAQIKKEFERIYKKYNREFTSSSLQEGDGTIDSFTWNFFSNRCAVAPMAITWAGPDKKKELCLILTLRMTVRENRADLPVPFYTF